MTFDLLYLSVTIAEADVRGVLKFATPTAEENRSDVKYVCVLYGIVLDITISEGFFRFLLGCQQ